MEQAFQEVVRQRKAEGVTILLSSHILAEVEALADRVSIIRKGRRVQTGSLSDLRQHTRTTVRAVTHDRPHALDAMSGVADYTAKPASDGSGSDLSFTVDPDHLDAAIAALHSAGIKTLTVNPPSLDALFLRSYGEDINKPDSSSSSAASSPAGDSPAGDSPAGDASAANPSDHGGS
jgi:ABC-2 type transport system ATP-binding protein